MQALSRTDAHVMSTLNADRKIPVDFRPVVNGIATRTLRPEPLGNRALGGCLGTDFGWDQFMKPAHVRPLEFRRMGY